MRKPLERRVTTQQIMEHCDIKNRNTLVRFMEGLGVFPVVEENSKRTHMYRKAQAERVIREYKKLPDEQRESTTEIVRLREQFDSLRKTTNNRHTHTTERIESIGGTTAHNSSRLDLFDGIKNTISSQGKHIQEQKYQLQQLRDIIDSQGAMLDALASAVQKLGGTILFERFEEFEKVSAKSGTPPPADFMKAK